LSATQKKQEKYVLIAIEFDDTKILLTFGEINNRENE
jgi:hypothetical protein